MKAEILRFSHISLKESKTRLLDHVSFQVFTGEIHGILGLTGTGNDALIRLLSGQTQPSQGQIFYDDNLIKILSPKMALVSGIYCIPPEGSLIKTLTVLENLMILDNALNKKILFNDHRLVLPAIKLLSEFLGGVAPETQVKDLSPYRCHLLEIVKALSVGARLIIANGITENYSENQILKFNKILQQIQKRGTSVILLMNNIAKSMRYCDRITTIFHGVTVKTISKNQFSRSQLLSCLFGGTVESPGIPKNSVQNQNLLDIKKLRVSVFPQYWVDLKLNRGEVLGLIDYEGNFSSRILDALYGLNNHTESEILLNNVPVKLNTPQQAFNSGIIMVGKFSSQYGFMGKLNAEENVYFPAIRKSSYPLGILRKKFLNREAQKSLASVGIDGKKGDVSQVEQALEVLLARINLYYGEVLLMKNSTEGLNYSDTQKVFNFLKQYVSKNKGAIIVSSDITEIYSICDRYYEINDGILKEKNIH